MLGYFVRKLSVHRLNQIHLRIPFICCRRLPSFNDWLIVDKKVCPTFSDMTKKVW